MILAVVVALLVGAIVGAALARRMLRAAAEADEIPVPVDEPDALAEPADGGEGDLLRDVAPLLRDAVDRLDLAIVVCDAEGRIVYRNTPASALGGTHVGILLEGHVDEALRTARASGRTEKRVDLHGPPRTSLLLVAERTGDGSAVVTIEDVSERERIDSMRTDFVANISHELKTPVGAIAVLAEALEDESDPDVVGRVSERIVEESRRAVGTIDDLLELSRIESARLDDEVINLHDVVHAAIGRGRNVDEQKNVRVTAFDARQSIWIRGDRRQLASAVGNLVENAVKYSDPDGMVQVRTRVDERHIEVMVADQGLGIPARDLDRVFERFYRVDRARSRETGGTGLGLSIVRHVATNHGGDVLVSSQEGEGSTFVFRLPVSLLVDAPDDSISSGAAPAPPTATTIPTEEPRP